MHFQGQQWKKSETRQNVRSKQDICGSLILRDGKLLKMAWENFGRKFEKKKVMQ